MERDPPALTAQLASRLARIALMGIANDYPNYPGYVLTAANMRRPRLLRPAFYDRFDRHLAVHAHWQLMRLNMAALRQAGAGLAGVGSGEDMGGHWLGSFALYMLGCAPQGAA